MHRPRKCLAGLAVVAVLNCGGTTERVEVSEGPTRTPVSLDLDREGPTRVEDDHMVVLADLSRDVNRLVWVAATQNATAARRSPETSVSRATPTAVSAPSSESSDTDHETAAPLGSYVVDGIAFTAAMPVELASFFACVAKRESGGDYGAVSPSGRYRSRYQADENFARAYLPAEWKHLADSGNWETAPPEAQDAMAVNGFRARGAAPWMGACS